MPLRVCSWNVQLGRRLEVVLSALEELGRPDVLALQEVSRAGGLEDAARLAERLGPEYKCWQVTAQLLRGREQANALIWNRRRVAVEQREVLDLPRSRRSRRNALMIEGRFGRRRLRLFCVHLDVLGVAHRRDQLRAVLDHDADRPAADLTVIAGDLNTFGLNGRPAWAGLYAEALAHGFQDVTAGVGWTQARLRVRQKLDAVLARPPELVSRSWALDLPGSDHIPVLAEIA